MLADTATSLLERRRHPRTQLAMSVNCIRLDPDGGDVADRIHVVDISRRGMGAICDRAFYPGQRVVLCMPLTEQAGGRSIAATVVRCRQRNEGYRIGFEFDAGTVAGARQAEATMAA